MRFCNVAVAAGGAIIMADSEQLRLMLTNLLLNAAQAMECRGRIRLSARIEGRRCEMVVQDSGPGMPEEVRARVLMFSTRVHLVLDIREASHTIRFRDRCGRSFDHYEGAWTLSARSPARVEERYALAARPAFAARPASELVSGTTSTE